MLKDGLTFVMSVNLIIWCGIALYLFFLDKHGVCSGLSENIKTGNHYHGDTNRYPVKNPQLNYSAVTGDLGIRWFILPWLHLTVHGGATFYRRYEFSDGRKSVAKYDPSNCLVFQAELGMGG